MPMPSRWRIMPVNSSNAVGSSAARSEVDDSPKRKNSGEKIVENRSARTTHQQRPQQHHTIIPQANKRPHAQHRTCNQKDPISPKHHNLPLKRNLTLSKPPKPSPPRIAPLASLSLIHKNPSTSHNHSSKLVPPSNNRIHKHDRSDHHKRTASKIILSPNLSKTSKQTQRSLSQVIKMRHTACFQAFGGVINPIFFIIFISLRTVHARALALFGLA